jgi:hypothetical protein
MGRHSRPDLPGEGTSGVPTATGYHRAVGSEATPRGIAKWPFALLAAIAIIGAGVFAVMWGTNSLGNTADAEGGECTEGRRTLRIIVTPKLVEPMVTIGDRWNAADRVVDATCISIEVSGADEDAALKAISRLDGVLAVPAVWVPESTGVGDRLTEENPERVATVDEPLTSGAGTVLPYIVIDGDGVDEVQLRAAQEFRDYLDEPEQGKVLQAAGFVS